MSDVPEVAFCPYRTNIDQSNVRFSNFSHVQYFRQSDSEGEEEDADQQGKSSSTHAMVGSGNSDHFAIQSGKKRKKKKLKNYPELPIRPTIPAI